MRSLLALVALMVVTSCAGEPKHPSSMRWAMYYDKQLPAKAFKGMDLVVFDRTYYPKFKKLKNDTIVLAYVSIGEAHGNAPEISMLREEKIILSHNDTWKSEIIDITSPIWKKMVMHAIQDADKKGFDGVMLDTLDSPLAWTQAHDPGRFAQMKLAAIGLIEAIRTQYPNMKLMLNRGFDILPAAASKIDYVLAESILTHPNDSTGQFEMLSTTSYAQAVTQLHNVAAIAPRLQVFTLDYWDQDDVNGLERIYATQRAAGFIPYVTTPDLRHFTPEPNFGRAKTGSAALSY